MLGILRRSRRRKRTRTSRPALTTSVIFKNTNAIIPSKKVRLVFKPPPPLKPKQISKVRKLTLSSAIKKNIEHKSPSYIIKDFKNDVRLGLVCKRRKDLRRKVFKISRGKGMKVKKTNWSLESFVRC